jgi:hypothetical protein
MILEYIGESGRMPFGEHLVLIERYEGAGHVAVLVQDGDGEQHIGPASVFRQKPAGRCLCDVCWDEQTGRNPKPVGIEVDMGEV